MEPEEIENFIGQDTKELEKAFGLTQYFETKTTFPTHKFISEVLSLLKDPVIIRSNDGVVEDIFKLDTPTIKQGLIDDDSNKGIFFTRAFETVFWFFDGEILCLNLGCLMLTTTESNSKKIENILIENGIEFFKEEPI